MSDFSTKQPAPQDRAAESRDPDTSGVPKDNSPAPAPHSELADFGPGPGIPANSRKIS